MNRDIAIALLDRLHAAQNEFYAGSGAAVQHVILRHAAAPFAWR
jgi:hypothetical protein